MYEREFGSDVRTLVEQTYDKRTWDGRPLVEHIREDKMWGEIRRMARTNPTLKAELDRVIMLYKLIKEEHNG